MGILEETLENHLNGWRENRISWPLWTYNRAPYQRTASFAADGALLADTQTPLSWRLCAAWIERLRWSALVPYLTLVRTIERASEELKFLLTRFPEPGEEEVPGFVRGEGTPRIARVSLSFRLRAYAIFASLAPEVPATLDEFSPPTDYCGHGWLDATDRDEIGQRVQRILFKFRPNSEQLPAGIESRPPSALFLYFMELSSRMLKGDPEGVEHLRREGDLLGRVLTRAVGLFPGDLSGGARSTLPEEIRIGLIREAEEIVSAVRDYNPALESAEAYARFLEAVGGHDALAIERARRTARGAPARVGANLLVLAFPFLTPMEVLGIREHGWDAKKLFSTRLVAEVSDRTLRRWGAVQEGRSENIVDWLRLNPQS